MAPPKSVPPINLRLQTLRNVELVIAKFARQLEIRAGRVGASLVVGLTCLMVAMIYVRPALHPTVLGIDYAALARDPFPTGGVNPLGYRILTPLISYLIGLRGEGILITNLIFAFLLIALIYYCLRKAGISAHYSFLSALAFSVSAPTTITVFHGGYTDSLTYLLLAVGYFYRRRPIVFWLSFGLGLFNREAVLFLLPWLVLLRYLEVRKWRTLVPEVVAATAISVSAYWLFRGWVSSHSEVSLGVMHYIGPLLTDPLCTWRESFGYQTLGLLTVYKMLWLVPFAAICYLARKRDWTILLSLLILGLGTYAQFLVAFDSSRLFCLAFPLMIVAWELLLPQNRLRIKQWFFPLLLLNIFVPNIYTAGNVIVNMHGLAFAVVRRLLFWQL